jgi:hypothetical protein
MNMAYPSTVRGSKLLCFAAFDGENVCRVE